MMVATKYDYAQTVYLKTDTEQGQFIIGDIQIIGGRVVKYNLCQGKYSNWHDEEEISAELDLCKKLSSSE